MIVLRFDQTFINANCYILADEEKRCALVVDPGAGSALWVARMLEKYDLELHAVLCTHGHGDHVWSSATIAGSKPVFVPEPDLYRFEDPAAYTSSHDDAYIAYSGHQWVKPSNLCPLGEEFFVGGGAQLVPGVTIRAIPAPGHTEGSAVFLVAGTVNNTYAEHPCIPEVCNEQMFALSADVIFRDGVGRSDLPGGDPVAMSESLRTLSHVIDPQIALYPGHGPSTTMGREISSSVYLRDALI